jgi:hypothetical protein
LSYKKIFETVVPDLPISCRDLNEDSVSLGANNPSSQNEARGALRLRVLSSLPVLHQRYLFEEIRKRSARYLRSRRISGSEVNAQEMLSEVWKKLLSSVSVLGETASLPFDESSIDLDAPDRDGRVVWLIEEIGGPEAMSHRYEDILRQRWGRSKDEVGRPIVQPDGDGKFELVGTTEPPIEIGEVARLAWLGLNRLAKRRFPPDDDVSMLLQLFIETPDLFDEATRGQWPINDIVGKLNLLFPDPAWRVDRVENAKKRLMKWIERLKKDNGFDQIDLEAFLVRIAKESQSEPTKTIYVPS